MIFDRGDVVRFSCKIRPRGDCYEWIGMIDRRTGYGRFKCKGETLFAHRFAYTVAMGPIPKPLQIDHLCRHRWCVRPSHLDAVTAKENINRGISADRNRAKTHCPRGHAYDEPNTYHQRSKSAVSGRSRRCKACRTLIMREIRKRHLYPVNPPDPWSPA